MLKVINKYLFYLKLNFKVIKGIFISKKDIHKFEKIKNIWKWKRCFILWNWPSIQNYDLSKLENEDVFITNRWYFLKDLWLKNIKYYVLTDKFLYPHDKINIDSKLKNVKYKFFSQVAKDKYEKSDIVFRFKNIFLWEQMYKTFSIFTPYKWMSEWWTVVLDCLNIADYLWYEKIYFLWIDMSYNKWNEHFYKKTKKEEKQSFINFQKITKSFENAKSNLESRWKSIFNLTKESKLKVLEFVNYDYLFKK